MRGRLGSRRQDLDAIEGDIITIEADIIFILAFMVDIDIAITNILGNLYEIVHHFHTYERWMQPSKQANPTTHVASPIGVGTGDFQIDAGNDDWGEWVQILGSDDTPVQADMIEYDLHRLVFTSTEPERNAPYFVQIGFGASGADALTDGTYTEIVFMPISNQIDSGPIEILTEQQDAGTLAWARCMCPGQDTAMMDFFFGLHEYEE